MALAGIETERDAFGHWLSGFVDGEGCFGIYCYKQGKVESFVGILSFEFSIQLREDDRAILEKIKAYFGCGTLAKGSRARSRSKGHPNARDQYKFSCRKIEDLTTKVVPHFEKYPLRSKKAGDFEIWKKALELQILSFRLRGGKTRPIKGLPECVKIREDILGLAVRLRAGRNPGLQRGEKTLVPLMN
jgi:hypothetical protein